MSSDAKLTSPPAEILIVEDSPTQAQKLQYILEQQQYHVSVAANGVLALAAAQRRKPTLIISDVVMPEMDGYELCRRVKSDAALADVPVVLVTTLSDPQDVIRGLECRADNFILKPYDERYLLARIWRYISRAKDISSLQIGCRFSICCCRPTRPRCSGTKNSA